MKAIGSDSSVSPVLNSVSVGIVGIVVNNRVNAQITPQKSDNNFVTRLIDDISLLRLKPYRGSPPVLLRCRADVVVFGV